MMQNLRELGPDAGPSTLGPEAGPVSLGS